MFGCFLGGNIVLGSSGTGTVLSPLTHPSTMSQSAGIPKKLLSQPEKLAMCHHSEYLHAVCKYCVHI